MSSVTIGSRGRLTIPKPVRHALGLRSGDRVTMVIDGDRIILYPPQRKNILDLHGVFSGPRPYPGRQIERELVMREASREALGLSESNE